MKAATVTALVLLHLEIMALFVIKSVRKPSSGEGPKVFPQPSENAAPEEIERLEKEFRESLSLLMNYDINDARKAARSDLK